MLFPLIADGGGINLKASIAPACRGSIHPGLLSVRRQGDNRLSTVAGCYVHPHKQEQSEAYVQTVLTPYAILCERRTLATTGWFCSGPMLR